MTQWAAVTRRSPARLATTLAVQKGSVEPGRNNGPTVARPANGWAVGVPGGSAAVVVVVVVVAVVVAPADYAGVPRNRPTAATIRQAARWRDTGPR